MAISTSFLLFILPIRDGNKVNNLESLGEIVLFILPIRDGNWGNGSQVRENKSAFYTSYKGWKHGRT